MKLAQALEALTPAERQAVARFAAAVQAADVERIPADAVGDYMAACWESRKDARIEGSDIIPLDYALMLTAIDLRVKPTDVFALHDEAVAAAEQLAERAA